MKGDVCPPQDLFDMLEPAAVRMFEKKMLRLLVEELGEPDPDRHHLKFMGRVDDQGVCVYLFQCQHCWVNWRVEKRWFWDIA